MALSELGSEMGKVTWGAPMAVDKAPLSLPARWGIDPRLNRVGVSPRQWMRSGLVGHSAEQRGARPNRKRKARSHQSIAACGLARRRSRAIAEFPPPAAQRAAFVQRRGSSLPR